MSLSYPSDDGPREVLHQVDLDVPAGQFLAVVGPSGCGKSTLLRCAAGLTRPTEGDVVIDTVRIDGPARGTAVVFQEYGRSLFGWRTIRANVELGARLASSDRRERMALAASALSAVGLADRGDDHPWQLSGGMQQRVAIARAIASRPRVLLMDEPFAAVDAQTREDLEDLIRRIWRETEVTILFVTHDIDEAVYLSERVLVMGAAPWSVRADHRVPLPRDRDQVSTRALPAFNELRAAVRGQVRAASAPAESGREATSPGTRSGFRG